MKWGPPSAGGQHPKRHLVQVLAALVTNAPCEESRVHGPSTHSAGPSGHNSSSLQFLLGVHWDWCVGIDRLDLIAATAADEANRLYLPGKVYMIMKKSGHEEPNLYEVPRTQVCACMCVWGGCPKEKMRR